MKVLFLDTDGCNVFCSAKKDNVILKRSKYSNWVDQFKGTLMGKLVSVGDDYKIILEGVEKELTLDISQLATLRLLLNEFNKSTPNAFSKYVRFPGWRKNDE